MASIAISLTILCTLMRTGSVGAHNDAVNSDAFFVRTARRSAVAACGCVVPLLGAVRAGLGSSRADRFVSGRTSLCPAALSPPHLRASGRQRHPMPRRGAHRRPRCRLERACRLSPKGLGYSADGSCSTDSGSSGHVLPSNPIATSMTASAAAPPAANAGRLRQVA